MRTYNFQEIKVLVQKLFSRHFAVSDDLYYMVTIYGNGKFDLFFEI